MVTTTVTAHTGSTKTGTYKVATGTLVEYVTRNIGPNHYVVDVIIIDAEGVEYRTGVSRIIEQAVTVTEDVAPEVAPLKPRSIRFGTVTCGRCDGERRNPMWGKVAGGWCFQCGGVGVLSTQAGKEAEAAYERMCDERLGARYGDIALGEAYKRDGKLHVKAAGALIHPSVRVRRHNGAITRQIWAEIAAQYPGATLVY
jgi:hypothetical protein